MKVFDEVLGKEVNVQGEVTPENAIEIILPEIAPDIDVSEEDIDED